MVKNVYASYNKLYTALILIDFNKLNTHIDRNSNMTVIWNYTGNSVTYFTVCMYGSIF